MQIFRADGVANELNSVEMAPTYFIRDIREREIPAMLGDEIVRIATLLEPIQEEGIHAE